MQNQRASPPFKYTKKTPQEATDRNKKKKNTIERKKSEKYA